VASETRDKGGFARELEVVRGGEGGWVDPELIVVDHRQNHRAAWLTWTPPGGDGSTAPCCFSEADVEELIGNLVALQQQLPVDCWVDGKGFLHLAEGYRRHFAFTVAASRGIVIDSPKGPGLIKFRRVPRAKLPADQLVAMDRNVSENVQRRGLSALDIAFNMRTYTDAPASGGFGLTYDEAAARLQVSTSHARKCMQVLGAGPAFKREWFPRLHRGVAIERAVAAMRKAGEGNTAGKQAGLPKSGMTRALRYAAEHEDRACPSAPLCPAHAERLLRVITGVDAVDGKTPPCVIEWVRFLSPPPDLGKKPREPKASKKAAPPRVDSGEA
jgi:hypothetical protein